MMLLILLLFLSALPQSLSCGCESKPEINVLAVVNGVKITKLDLSINTRTQVTLEQEKVIAARSQALDQMIGKLVLETEAKRRGLTLAQLLELEVTAKIVEPTEKEARAVYDEYKPGTFPDFKLVKNELIERLKNQREALRRIEFANSLRVRAQVATADQMITPPASEEDLARVFATVNGVNITSRDIEASLLPLISQVQQKVYTLRKQDLDLKINDLLLEQEAKRLETTVQALIYQNVNTRIPLITEEQARAWHDEHKKDLPGDFSEVKLQIMQFLFKQEQQKASLAYAEELRKGAAVQIYLTKPGSPDLRQLCCNPVD